MKVDLTEILMQRIKSKENTETIGLEQVLDELKGQLADQLIVLNAVTDAKHDPMLILAAATRVKFLRDMVLNLEKQMQPKKKEGFKPMLTIISMLFLLVVTACGADPTGQNQEQQNSGNDDNDVNYVQDEKQIVVEYRKNGNVYAAALNDYSEMPECDMSNNKQLVYIKEPVDKFYSCEDEAWEEVQFAKQGPPGPQGPKGDPADPLPANVWEDPFTQDQWLVLAKMNYATVTINQPCSGDWRLPTQAEGLAAAVHGIYTFSHDLNNVNEMWTSETIDATYQVTVELSPARTGSALKTDINTVAVFCIKD